MKDPNLRVQEAIALIFQTFRQTWSARQTFRNRTNRSRPVNGYLSVDRPADKPGWDADASR